MHSMHTVQSKVIHQRIHLRVPIMKNINADRLAFFIELILLDGLDALGAVKNHSLCTSIIRSYPMHFISQIHQPTPSTEQVVM
ncbi:MAG: hypothetical protein EZS28_028899 [Streblomastix strix]|uniref:Uncharacterized protein n=1 Tax=Streblomastix strix TaxID=222440 RepID=A0A5J4UZB6_9EUKA|nr:MAG: hypothetical protein EZS28_028899 [Streblomastix strix]